MVAPSLKHGLVADVYGHRRSGPGRVPATPAGGEMHSGFPDRLNAAVRSVVSELAPLSRSLSRDG